jgi:hypothetical protein
MDSTLKKKLRAISLGLRHVLEFDGDKPGDLHLRLNEFGIWPDRPLRPLDELLLTDTDRTARDTVEAFFAYRQEAGVSQETAFHEFVRESAYSWANRLFTLRCLEARNLIDPVILQQQIYGGRSLVHHRFSRQNPTACVGEDDGLFAVLAEEFSKRAAELPALFDPKAPGIALRPSVSALKCCIQLLSSAEDDSQKNSDKSDELFQAPDALGWAYQFWNAEEKDRVFERIRTEKGAKIENVDLIPATQLYTEPYMVKFLVQNSLGARWASMYPDSRLPEHWEYYVRDADRIAPMHPDPAPFDPKSPMKSGPDPWIRPNPDCANESDIIAYAQTITAKIPVAQPGSFVDLRNQLLDAAGAKSTETLSDLNRRACEAWDREWPERRPKLHKAAAEITFLDPACGSGHFLLEAFDLLFQMYQEEAVIGTADEICASILNHNLFGVDIDARAIQIAYAALWMHASERAPSLSPHAVTNLDDHLVAANVALPKGGRHLTGFLQKHPEDAALAPALDAVFHGLGHAEELGTLLRIDEPVERLLQNLQDDAEIHGSQLLRESQGKLGFLPEQYALAESPPKRDYGSWKRDVLGRLNKHFQEEAAVSEPVQRFFGRDARQGLALFDVLSRRYDVVAANPPYLGLKNMGDVLRAYIETHYTSAKRDLYAPMMLRSLELCQSGGSLAVVTPHTWMFQDTFDEMRFRPESSPADSTRGLLYDTQIELLAQLGRHAFTEVDPPSNVVLAVARKLNVDSAHQLIGIQIGTPRPAEEQASLLRSVARGASREFVFKKQQLGFVSIPHAPVCFSVPEGLYHLITTCLPMGRGGSGWFSVRNGLDTGDNPRFVRYFWEVGQERDWASLAKGGGYRKWAGFDSYSVNWRKCGERIRAAELSGTRFQNTGVFFLALLTYTLVARGCLGVRLVDNAVFDGSGLAIEFTDVSRRLTLAGLLNSHLVSFFCRLFSQSIRIRGGYLERVPTPPLESPQIEVLSAEAHRLKLFLTSLDPCDRAFSPMETTKVSVLVAIASWIRARETASAKLHAVEGALEWEVASVYQLKNDDITAVSSETGVPVGWLPFLTGYSPADSSEFGDAPLLPIGSRFAGIDKKTTLGAIKQKLRSLYVQGSGTDLAGEDDAEVTSDDEDVVSLTGKPIPAETFIEEISQKIGIHPISVCLLLDEMRNTESLVCRSEMRTCAETYVSTTILRILGHRWPKESLGDQPLSTSEADGVIVISGTSGKPSLLRRLSDCFNEHFGLNAIGDMEQVLGMTLARWLESEFFLGHMRQFRSRPIAWQLRTRPSSLSVGPVMSCLIYGPSVAGILPNLRITYAGTLRASFESEIRSLKALERLTTEQDARRLHLEEGVEELREFQDSVQRVEARGFETGRLRNHAICDAVHSLTRAWLGRLRHKIAQGPLNDWLEKVTTDGLTPALSGWISDAVDNVDRQCVALAPAPPLNETPDDLLTPTALAELFKGRAVHMVHAALEAICREWQEKFAEALLQPLKHEVKVAEGKINSLAEVIENALHRKDLKSEIKKLKKTVADLAMQSRTLALHVKEWQCPEAEQWHTWLGTQPLYDEISSLDGRRLPPSTVAEFVAQESQYQPDSNDGVRVNIAPLQKVGILARDVLPIRDIDKAIADRAEWRADERRWVRQGILPRPGWWPPKSSGESEPSK